MRFDLKTHHYDVNIMKLIKILCSVLEFMEFSHNPIMLSMN